MKTVMRTIYIANDGTEFSTSEECRKYENDVMRKEYLNKMKNIYDEVFSICAHLNPNPCFTSCDAHDCPFYNESDGNCSIKSY